MYSDHISSVTSPGPLPKGLFGRTDRSSGPQQKWVFFVKSPVVYFRTEMTKIRGFCHVPPTAKSKDL